METFDFSEVPYSFGVCAANICPKASVCLRHIALEHAPAKYPFLPTLTPNKLASMKDRCEYFRSVEKIRYAKGFIHTLNALTVGVAGTFRWRLILHFGRKNYYLVRKGDLLIKPADQQFIVRLAQESGLQLDDYFDDYVDGYNWED